jgi:hypothetical protein
MLKSLSRVSAGQQRLHRKQSSCTTAGSRTDINIELSVGKVSQAAPGPRGVQQSARPQAVTQELSVSCVSCASDLTRRKLLTAAPLAPWRSFLLPAWPLPPKQSPRLKGAQVLVRRRRRRQLSLRNVGGSSLRSPVQSVEGDVSPGSLRDMAVLASCQRALHWPIPGMRRHFRRSAQHNVANEGRADHWALREVLPLNSPVEPSQLLHGGRQ